MVNDAIRWLSLLMRGRMDRGRILSKKELRHRKFKGWDWTELAEMWGLLPKHRSIDDVSEDDLLQAIKDHVFNSWQYRAGKHCIDPQIKADMDNYLITLIETDPGFLGPVYRGLLQVENEHEYVRVYLVLLQMMWS